MDDATGTVEYDRWNWHIEGAFPKDQPAEQGFVHIGLFLTWLIEKGMLDRTWVARAGAGDALAEVEAGKGTGSALRDACGGAFTSDMLTAEGRAFAGAYYLPEYGYAQDYSRTFGRQADGYAVPDSWASYERLAPTIDRRHAEWIAAGRPPLVPMQTLLPSWLRFLRPRG